MARGQRTWRMPYVYDRLSVREYLSADQMWQRHFAAYPVEAVRGVFAVLEGEGIPAGLLRPSDDVESVLQPPPTWNPDKVAPEQRDDVAALLLKWDDSGLSSAQIALKLSGVNVHRRRPAQMPCSPAPVSARRQPTCSNLVSCGWCAA